MSNEAIKVMEISLGQEADSCVNGFQTLKIIRTDAGGGDYWVLQTDRWAFDSFADLIAQLNDLERRLS